MKLTIGHLYPDLLNLYGDRGNIQCMMKRLQWRGIEAETIEFEIQDEVDFSELDIVLLGGGSDREQMLVCERLKEIRDDFKAYVEDGGVVLAVCGGYQLLGTHYSTDQGVIEGLSIVDIYTEQSGYEGIIYKNVIGTYLHGPLLPKNPQICDYLLTKALERKYKNPIELAPLDDTEEREANTYIYQRFKGKVSRPQDQEQI